VNEKAIVIVLIFKTQSQFTNMVLKNSQVQGKPA